MEVPRASEGSGGHASIQEFRVHSSSRTVDSPSPRLFKFRVFSSSSSFEFEFGELGGADLAFEFELAALAELELELFSRLRPCASSASRLSEASAFSWSSLDARRVARAPGRREEALRGWIEVLGSVPQTRVLCVCDD